MTEVQQPPAEVVCSVGITLAPKIGRFLVEGVNDSFCLAPSPPPIALTFLVVIFFVPAIEPGGAADLPGSPIQVGDVLVQVKGL